jgi:hypothetical protein
MEQPDLRRDPAERRAAAVLPGALAVWPATEIMHLHGFPGSLEMAGAAALSAVAVWGAAGRGMVPPSAPAWTAAAGVLLTAADVLGPFAYWPAVPFTLAWAAFALAASRAARRHEAVVSAREWREARADWLGRSHNWGLGGSHLLAFERTPFGELYTVSTKGTRKRASQLVGHALEEIIAEAEDLAVNRVQVRKHGLAGRLVISVRRTDPYAGNLLHPLVRETAGIELPERRSIRVPVLVGQDPETGEALEIPLWDTVGAKNVSVTGMVGAGKGVLLDDVSEWVTAAPDALQVRINLSGKGYQEIESWGPSCHLTAFGEDQKSRAVAVLKIVSGVIAWRTRAYKRGQYQPSPADPLIVVIVDESDEAARVRAVKEGLDTVATKGREYGVALVHAGQRGTNDYSSSKQRSQDTVRCTGAVNRQGEVRHAAGNQAHAVRDMASYAEGQPGVWTVAAVGRAPRDGRTWVFGETPAAHGAEVERIAQERAFAQPELPAACRKYLGETYETLLSTEVFTRWAQGRDPHEFAPQPGGSPETDQQAPAASGPETETCDGQEAVTAPGSIATAEADPFAGLEMDVPEDMRAAFAALDAKLAGVRETLAETAAMPRPEVPPEVRAAYAAEQWRLIGEEAKIPAEARPRLTEMLAEGTTIGAVAAEFGVTKPVARGWLQKYRNANAAYVDGERRGAKWRLATPPGDGDAQ